MSNVFVDDATLTAIADAIRTKNGTTESYKPAEMASAISAITTGGSGGGEIIDSTEYDYSNLIKLEVTIASPSHTISLADYLTGNEKVVAVSTYGYPAGHSAFYTSRVGVNNYITEDGYKYFSSLQPLSNLYLTVSGQEEYLRISPAINLTGQIEYNYKPTTFHFKSKVYIFYYLPKEG